MLDRAAIEQITREVLKRLSVLDPLGSGPSPAAAPESPPPGSAKFILWESRQGGAAPPPAAGGPPSAAGGPPSAGGEKVKLTEDVCRAWKDVDVECTGAGKCVVRKKGSVEAILLCGADRITASEQVSGSEVDSRIARLIDHTLLKSNATQEEVATLCEEAKKYRFASVCINPVYVPFCAAVLRGTEVKVCTVIGFPLGATTSTVKAIEARDAIANGADEIDMVLNVGALKSGNRALVEEDIRAVREATRGKTLKVILETAYLTREEKITACQISRAVGADFVKTSTGFGPSGATVEDILLMREVVGPTLGVKASGGVRTREDARKLVAAGATRIGASASVAIVTGQKSGDAKY